MIAPKKKLIEVALPLEAINKASAREKSIRHGHPSTLHLWWARRPLAAARAVIFAQMVDDPSSCPELFPTEKAQEKERQRLFRIIEDLVQWENTTNEKVLQHARDEIWQSWRRACAENAGHPRAKELFDRNKLPAFHDPFAGGGSLPLEAQRLGLEAYASDLNPVAVLICKAMIEIPPKFAGRPPVNPDALKNKELFTAEGAEKSLGISGDSTQQSSASSAVRSLGSGERGPSASPAVSSLGSGEKRSSASSAVNSPWRGAQGLAEDVRYYGQWMRDEAEKRIGHLYPKIKITAEVAEGRSDLKPYIGHELTVIAWLWARTVKSPNPAFANVDVPLASTFMLSTKPGKEAYVEPIVELPSPIGRGAGVREPGYRFTVKMGKPRNAEAAKNGTKLSRGANFRCLMSGTPLEAGYIRSEAQAGRMRARLMAIVAEGERGRVYLSPTPEHETIARKAKPTWKPDLKVTTPCHDVDRLPMYGMPTWGDAFTPRQLMALTTFSDFVLEARERVKRDALAAGLSDDGRGLAASGTAATAYADAVAMYLGFCVDKMTDTNTCLCSWQVDPPRLRATFGRQALPMVWDYAEANVFGDAAGDFGRCVQSLTEVLDRQDISGSGHALQQDVTVLNSTLPRVFSTDPPYYDNIGYADLSDFFYIWLRRSLRPIFPDLFATLAVPKAEELVATPYRHGSKEKAEAFFLDGMTRAMRRLAEQTHPGFPVTIYYAFKQSESESEAGTASTGWETFLDAVIRAGFAISGTWPMRSELATRNVGRDTNALASSIILVCRPQPQDVRMATLGEFRAALKRELPAAVAHLQQSNIAPVDLQQSAIGPGMAIFSRYARVLDAEGKPVPVRDALALINQILDEVLAEQEGDFEADTRWALAWFEQFGFSEGEYGVAETLSKAKNTSVAGMAESGVVTSKAGKVRLLKPSELPADFDRATNPRLTVWEMVHHLIRSLEAGGESAAAELVAKLGSKAEVARELAYRLYTICDRKRRA
jgi:putative DNA methylase